MQELLLPNLLESFSNTDLESDQLEVWTQEYLHLAQKGLFWATAPRALLLTHSPPAPSVLGFWRQEALHFIPEVEVVPRSSFNLSQDALDSGPTMDSLSKRLDRSIPIVFRPYVATMSAAALARALGAMGFRVIPDHREIERNAAVAAKLSIRHNACALFDEAGLASEMRPAWYPLSSWTAVRNFLADKRGTGEWVVKSSDSVGGSGVLIVDDDKELVRLAESVTPSRPSDERDEPLRMRAPFIVERLIGRPSGNVSPTCDVVPVGGERRLFQGLQILFQRYAYVGVLSLPRVTESTARVARAARLVGTELDKAGYSGSFNLDFVQSPGESLVTVDLNVRTSTPFDHFVTSERLRDRDGPGWYTLSLDHYTNDSRRSLIGIEPTAPSS